MTWAKLDDASWNNERLLALSPGARLLWYAVLSFVASEWPAGGGCVTPQRLKLLAALQGVDAEAAIAELKGSRRLERRAHGLLHLHDVEKYMPSPNLSAVRAEAGRKGGMARQRATTAQANSQAIAKQRSSSGSPVPEPVPVTRKDAMSADEAAVPGNGAPHDGRRRRLDDFVAVWNASCGGLPRLRKAPGPPAALSLVDRAWDAVDGDAAMLSAAIGAAADDRHYVEQRYGWETVCRHIDRWVGVASANTEDGRRVYAEAELR